MHTSITRSRRTKEMQAVIEKYHACDLTQRHFCKQEKLPLSTFTYWLRRCRRHDSPQANSSAALIPIKVKAAVSETQSSNCTIELPGGVLIHIYGAVNPGLIIQLINSVR